MINGHHSVMFPYSTSFESRKLILKGHSLLLLNVLSYCFDINAPLRIVCCCAILSRGFTDLSLPVGSTRLRLSIFRRFCSEAKVRRDVDYKVDKEFIYIQLTSTIISTIFPNTFDLLKWNLKAVFPFYLYNFGPAAVDCYYHVKHASQPI